MTNNRGLTDHEISIVGNVAEFGCHVTTVFDPEEAVPSFSYSTGFIETVEQGEVIIFGLAHATMHQMINLTLELCRGGLDLEDGARIGGLLEGFDVIVRAIPPERIDREHFNSAMWFHRNRFGSELKSAFQLVWPGALDGLFPWDAGCDEYVIGKQPALFAMGTMH